MSRQEAGAPAGRAGEPGQALFRLVRHWSRRQLAAGGTEAGDTGNDGREHDGTVQHGRDVWVTEAVHDLQCDGKREVTVNDVATELGIDQSGASRMLARAARLGYLDVTPSATDARRRTVAVTQAGRELLTAAHAWQEQVFATLTDDWTAAERTAFERGMRRIVERSSSLHER